MKQPNLNDMAYYRLFNSVESVEHFTLLQGLI